MINVYLKIDANIPQPSDVDECSRPGTCGAGAVCTNTAGSFACACPPNTIAEPDAYTQCLDIMSCQGPDDCPGNALCIASQCMCPEPNIGDDCRRKWDDESGSYCSRVYYSL